jgi:hypothetical protein
LHPKVRMFLYERDRARLRGDNGVIRSMNAELRRLNVPDEATLANPTGKRLKTKKEPEAVVPPKVGGRPKLPRCEHENIAERCPECNPELAAK